MNKGKTGSISAKEAEKQGKISQNVEQDFLEFQISLNNYTDRTIGLIINLAIRFLLRKIYERTYHE